MCSSLHLFTELLERTHVYSLKSTLKLSMRRGHYMGSSRIDVHDHDTHLK